VRPYRGAASSSIVTYDDAPRAHAQGPDRWARPLRIEPVRPGSTDVTITLDP